MIAKNKVQTETLRTAGRILASVLAETAKLVKPGVSTAALDLAADKIIKARGAVPAFLGYQPEGAAYPYPATLCVSVNDEVVHGLPSEERILKEGDIVSLDGGLSYKDYFVDAAITVPVGKVDEDAKKLLQANREALEAAISAARAGGHVGDIGAAVERVAKKYELSVVADLGGHAVGKTVHEKPYIPNEGREGEGEELPLGLVVAIEPMLCEGKGAIVLDKDQWTYKMRDGKRAAHFEHTVLITKNGPEILTVL